MSNEFKGKKEALKKLSTYLIKQQVMLSLLLLLLIILSRKSLALMGFLIFMLILSSVMLWHKLRRLSSCELKRLETTIYFQKRGLKEGSFVIDDGKKVMGLRALFIPFVGKRVHIWWDPQTRYVLEIQKK